MAVTTPTGSSIGERTVRAATSQATRNAAPTNAEAGITSRWSAPTSNLIRCGTMMPTKPIGPPTATAAPVASEALRNARRWVFSTSMPRVAALSAPRENGVVTADVEVAHNPAHRLEGLHWVSDVLDEQDDRRKQRVEGNSGKQED